MKPAQMPCHQAAVNKTQPCQHLTVADCAGPQMSSPSDAPQLAKAQLSGVEYMLLPQAQTQGRVQPLMEVMTHGPPATAPELLSILLTTQRYLI